MARINRASRSGGPADEHESLLPLHSAVVLLASLQTSEATGVLTIAAGQNLPYAALAAGSTFIASVPFFHKVVARRG